MRSELFANEIGFNQDPIVNRVCKKQKRVRAESKRGSKTQNRKATTKKNVRAKALHLLLGPEHFLDRAAAEKLRLFPNVPRKKQSPFPRDIEVGFAGHYKSGKFAIQGRKDFVSDFETNVENAWYWRNDKRVNRSPRREDAGLVETNAAMSTGLSRVLADLARKGKVEYVRNIALLASEAGMKLLCNRTGYLEGYLALHPDAEGTLSTHYGAWPIDPETHQLRGRSADGKRGRKGLRNIGDCFISLLRHDRAIGLPKWVKYRPQKNLRERDPDDWAIAEEMDRVVREEIGKLPNGLELLNLADEYQREAAEDWLRRYKESKAGVDKQHAELEGAHRRIAELEATVIRQNEKKPRKKKLPSLLPGISGVGKLMRSISNFCKGVGRRILEVVRSLPVIEITLPNYLVSTKASTIEEPPKLAESEARKPRGFRKSLAETFEKVLRPPLIRDEARSPMIKIEAECDKNKGPKAGGVKKSTVRPHPGNFVKDDSSMNM